MIANTYLRVLEVLMMLMLLVVEFLVVEISKEVHSKAISFPIWSNPVEVPFDSDRRSGVSSKRKGKWNR